MPKTGEELVLFPRYSLALGIRASSHFSHARLSALGSGAMSLILPEKFQHIHRVLNTNIDGNIKVPFALTAIKVPLLAS